jgi:CDP-diacylglycerol pyrophosphatase
LPGLVAFLLAAAAAAAPGGSPRDALRVIVQEQCLVHWREEHLAAPCEAVHVSDARPPDDRSPDAGYAILKDRKGGAHFLLIPTRTVSGIESPLLLEPAAPNYFAAAWAARGQLAGVVGHALRRGAVGLAVNSRNARSQDQLHIHIECLQPVLYDVLHRVADGLGQRWTPIDVPGWQLLALRVMGEGLRGANPFKLLAHGVAGAKDAMGDYSLLAAGMEFRHGPGFILLAGTGPGTERLLDPTCGNAAAAAVGAHLHAVAPPPDAATESVRLALDDHQ